MESYSSLHKAEIFVFLSCCRDSFQILKRGERLVLLIFVCTVLSIFIAWPWVPVCFPIIRIPRPQAQRKDLFVSVPAGRNSM